MLLRKWIPGIVPKTFVFDTVPVWIKLGRIALELWTDAGLAVVGSAIGKSLSFDLATKERRRLSLARTCVEMNVDSTMATVITVNLRGEEFIMNVTYEWKPRKCNVCHSFGHSNGTCPKSGASRKEDIRKINFVKDVVLVKEAVPVCEEYEDVELESFQQLEEGEINIPHLRIEKGKDDVKHGDFTLVDSEEIKVLWQ